MNVIVLFEATATKCTRTRPIGKQKARPFLIKGLKVVGEETCLSQLLSTDVKLFEMTRSPSHLLLKRNRTSTLVNPIAIIPVRITAQMFITLDSTHIG